ncbi:ABC transporter substrate-binding protein [Pseudochelatococcus sp. B33]
MSRRNFAVFGGRVMAALFCGSVMLTAAPALAKTRVTVSVTETIAGANPYADSVSLMNAVWCQVYGCMVRYDNETASYTSDFFESWTVEDPLTWVFTFKPGLKRSNGDPVLAEDIVHSFDRTRNDPDSKQKHRLNYVGSVEIRDPQTVVVRTTEPTATLLEYLKSIIITSKALYDEYGPAADREHPIGAGPYKLRRLQTDNYVAIEKNPEHPLVSADNPDEIIFRIMKEPEQRLTALFNNEVQIAQFIPPQLVPRLEANTAVKTAWNDSLEVMFVAMRPDSPPFDNPLVRQAVAHAIDRDAIIKAILNDQASRLDGPVGPGQVGYSPDFKPAYPYDPEKAKALLAEAGYPNGVEVDFTATVGRYTSDKQICEAIAAMLQKAGFKVNLKTPEWSTMWDDVQNGKTAFYYMGRGTVLDPSVMLAQYFETGGSPRVGYSNAEVDEMLQAERQTFDPAERMKLLQQAMAKIVEEAPGLFLWRHKMAWGVASNIDFQPVPTGEVYGWQVKVKN